MTFKKITTFIQENKVDKDVWQVMNESISFTQGTYCHPIPSEYFEDIEWKFNSDKTYCESHANYVSEEAYKDWIEMYGEIMEELYLEMIEDFKSVGITMERFIDNVEISGMFDAQPMDQFVSKIS